MNRIFTVLVISAMILQVGAVGAVSTQKINKDKEVTNPDLAPENRTNDLPPQEAWNKTYGGDGAQSFLSMDKTSDGGFIMAGQHVPPGGVEDSLNNLVEKSSAWLVKVNENGNLQWENKYSTPTTSKAEFRDVLQTSDGGYLAVGEEENQSYRKDGYIVKTDSQGNEVWNKTFRHRGKGTEPFSAIETPNGYVVAGYANTEENIGNAWIMKMDDNGNTVWRKTYGNTSWSLTGIVDAKDGYVAAGNSNPGEGYEEDGWWIKVDENGNVVWNTTLNKSKGVNDITDAGNGKYAFVGAKPVTNKEREFWFGVIDSNGNIKWTNTIGGPSTEFNPNIINTDKGYAMLGSTSSYGVNTPDKTNFWLLAVDENGNERWNTSFGGNDYDPGEDLVKEGDSFYLAGRTSSYGGEFGEGWLVKATPSANDTLSIEEAIANLKSENDIINFSELQSAINFWIQNKEVPGTGGEKIAFIELQNLINLWVQGEKV